MYLAFVIEADGVIITTMRVPQVVKVLQSHRTV